MNNMQPRNARANERAYVEKAPRRRVPFAIVAIIAILVAAVAAGASLCSATTPITVTVNGIECQLRGDKTMQVAIKESGLPVNPGDYITLQGNIIRRSEGYPFCAYVNGEETADPAYKLSNGDQIELTDGKDRVEEYDAVEHPVPFGASIIGTGPIHMFSEGVDGVMETRTGRESGEVVEKQTVAPQEAVETRLTPAVEGAQVIALTFDGGPSDANTGRILDILQANGARATFFCLGTNVDPSTESIIKRAAEQGCQICTHSYSDAHVTNGNFGLLGPEEVKEEIEQGLKVLADVLGTEPSRVARIGSEDVPKVAIPSVAPLLDAEIGWTLDTGDWINVGEEEVYNVLMSAKAGDIIRMHDGGGNRDDTIAALERALPKLKSQNFSFITIDEMMAYNMT